MKKVRDRLTVPGTIHTKFEAWNGSKSEYGEASSGTRSLGVYESIDSVYDGSFTPGILRLNPVTIVQKKCYLSEGVIKYRHPNYPNSYPYARSMECTGPLLGVTTTVPVPGNNFDSQRASYALAKAYAKMRAADLDLFVMAGELGETLRMLQNPMKDLIRAFTKAGRGGLDIRILDASSGAWLSWFYGVMPLIQDISSIITSVDKLYIQQCTALRSKRATSSSTSSNVTKGIGGYQSFTFDLQTTTKEKRKISAVIYYRANPMTHKAFTAKVLGFHWSQLPKGMWELVTASFVVDWVFDVGSWLNNITPDPSVTYLGNCVTQTTQHTAYNEWLNLKYGAFPATGSPGKYTVETRQMERKVNLSLPALPVFNTRFLELKNLITQLALIWGRIPREWKRSRYAS